MLKQTYWIWLHLINICSFSRAWCLGLKVCTFILNFTLCNKQFCCSCLTSWQLSQERNAQIGRIIRSKFKIKSRILPSAYGFLCYKREINVVYIAQIHIRYSQFNYCQAVAWPLSLFICVWPFIYKMKQMQINCTEILIYIQNHTGHLKCSGIWFICWSYLLISV